jgi:hypothetical protein
MECTMSKQNNTPLATSEDTSTFTVTMTLPARIRLYDIDGVPFYWNLAETVDKIGAKLVEVGGRTVLTNVRNGGGKDATEAERHAAVMKKLDAWAKGEFNVTERGESAYSSWREVWIADMIAAGNTQKASEEYLKSTVADILGKDTKATFANFIEATAVQMIDDNTTRDEARSMLESYYAAEADRRAKEREKAGAAIKMPTLDLSKFKK